MDHLVATKDLLWKLILEADGSAIVSEHILDYLETVHPMWKKEGYAYKGAEVALLVRDNTDDQAIQDRARDLADEFIISQSQYMMGQQTVAEERREMVAEGASPKELGISGLNSEQAQQYLETV